MLDNLLALWLPILAATAAVWITSALFWMLINHHDGDFAPLPADAEIDIITKLRATAAKPNAYVFPHHHNTNNDKKLQREKMSEGPAGTLTIFPKPTGAQMARNMLLSVLIYFAIALCIAYLAALALPIKNTATLTSNLPASDASFRRIFQFTATAGVLAYAFSPLTTGVWFGQPRRAQLLCLLDGLIYGLIAGAAFALLWPR